MNLPPWVDRLDEFDVHLFTIAGTDFTVSSVLKIALLLILLVWLADVLRRWTVGRALTHTHLDEGTRQAAGSIVRYLVLIIGVVVIAQGAGINVSALSVVAGALGVGVGFGLQNIFSNFVSGVIIMLERPIKVGDRIEMPTIEGTVREIGARRTTIVTYDNVAVLVPNQRFITEQVTNLVYAAVPIRLHVPVQVAAGTDVDTVERLMLEAAAAHNEVLKDPGPQVLRPTLVGAPLAFELCVWHDAHGPVRKQLTSDLNRLIDQRLRAAGFQYA